MKKNTIVKSNELIKASYDLTLVEQRILLMSISKINSGESISQNKLYKISVKEYSDLFAVSKKCAYLAIKKASETIFERSIIIYDEKVNKKYEISRWVQTISYNPEGGIICFRFSVNMIPYLSNLQSCFIRYHLSDIIGMRFKYSIRIYEMLMQWKIKEKVEIKVTNLRKTLMLENKYNKFNDFSRLVINPAIKDINTVTNYTISYELKKTGRKITSIVFNFLKKPAKKRANQKTLRLSNNNQTIVEFCRANEKLTDGLTFAQVEQIMKQK